MSNIHLTTVNIKYFFFTIVYMANKDIDQMIQEKVDNLKALILEKTQESDKSKTEAILSMVNKDEYITLGKQFLKPLRDMGCGYKQLIDGMISNFNLPDDEELRGKLNKYLEFFCSIIEKC